MKWCWWCTDVIGDHKNALAPQFVLFDHFYDPCFGKTSVFGSSDHCFSACSHAAFLKLHFFKISKWYASACSAQTFHTTMAGCGGCWYSPRQVDFHSPLLFCFCCWKWDGAVVLAPENYEVTRMEEYGRLWPIICSSLCGLAEFLLLEVFKLLFLPTWPECGSHAAFRWL